MLLFPFRDLNVTVTVLVDQCELCLHLSTERKKKKPIFEIMSEYNREQSCSFLIHCVILCNCASPKLWTEYELCKQRCFLITGQWGNFSYILQVTNDPSGLITDWQFQRPMFSANGALLLGLKFWKQLLLFPPPPPCDVQWAWLVLYTVERDDLFQFHVPLGINLLFPA